MVSEVVVPLRPGSDGDATHIPPIGSAYVQLNPPTLYLEKIGQQWMESRGEAKPGVKYVLERLPVGYTMWQRPRAKPNVLDKYLFGHPSCRKFDSPNRFFPHFKHLMENNGSSFGCSCTVCAGSSGILPSSRSATSGADSRRNSIASSVAMPAIHNRGKGRPKKTSAGMDTSRVDPEGTPDVYRNLIDRLQKCRTIDQAIEEPLSPDWHAEQSILPKMLSNLRRSPQWVPRTGDIVLYIQDLADGIRFARHKATGDIQLYSPQNDEFLGPPVWMAGLVGQNPTVEPTTADLLQRNNDVHVIYSGVRVQPVTDPNGVGKITSKRGRYISLCQCCPFILWQQLLHGVAEDKWHETIVNALMVTSTASLVGKYRFRGTWPEGYIYCHAMYLGAEMLAVGDTVRLLPNSKNGQTACVDILVIKSIRLKWSNLDKASNNDYDEGRPYNSEIWVYGAAWTRDASRSDKQWLSPETVDGPKSARGYGDWFPLHPTYKELAVPYSRLAGRLYEREAMVTWLIDDSGSVVDIDQGREGIMDARRFSMQHNVRIAREPGACWYWGDSRADTLNLQSINGFEVADYDQDRDVREWRKNMRIVEGVENAPDQTAGATAPLLSRDLRRFMAPGTDFFTDENRLPAQSNVRGPGTGPSSGDADRRPNDRRYQEIELSDGENQIRRGTRVVDNSGNRKGSKVMVVID